jgi:hypothetical protein
VPVGARNGPKGAARLHLEAHEGVPGACNDGTQGTRVPPSQPPTGRPLSSYCSLALATIPSVSDHSQGVGASLYVHPRPTRSSVFSTDVEGRFRELRFEGVLRSSAPQPCVGCSETSLRPSPSSSARSLARSLAMPTCHSSTLARHLANVYQKIGVRSRSEAVRMALMEQWIGIGEITSSVDADGFSGNPREN